MMIGKRKTFDGMPITVDELPELLARVRSDRGLTLKEASAQTGISTSTLSRIENGLFRPNSDHLVRLLDWLQIDLPRALPASIGHKDTMTRVALILKEDAALTREAADKLMRAWRPMYQLYARLPGGDEV